MSQFARKLVKLGVGMGAALVLTSGIATALANPDNHADDKHGAANPPATTPAASESTRVTKQATKPAAKPSQVIEAKSDGHAEPATKAAKPAMAGHEAAEGPTADQALEWLREGNARWAKGKTQNPNIEVERRAELADKGQKPFVTILTCADSRIPLERVFDRGVGDVFVVRVAGNIAGTSEGGTIEYGVEHLHTPVLVVMGHTKCGAVAAAASGAHLEGQLGALVDQIKPSIDRAKAVNPELKDKELVAAAIRENVWQTVFSLLKNSKTLREKAKAGELRIVGAIYDIADGTVDFMGPHPWQSELVAALDAREAKQGHAEAPEQDTDSGQHHP